MKYLDPKNDLTFKKVFGEHPELCRSFLNALLPFKEEDYIVEIEYLSPELVPELPLQKNTIVDVRCKDKKGRQFIVEMQMLWTDSFKQRVVFNASKAFIRQLGKKKEYKLLEPVYTLSLVDDTFIKDVNRFYHHYQIVNLENTGEQLKGLEFVFIELPKFKPDKMLDKKMAVLWLRYMTEIDENTKEIDNDFLKQKELKKAVDCIAESAFTKEELEHYDKYWDEVRTQKSIMLDSLTKGEAIGIKKGRKEGEVIGIQKGANILILNVLRKGKSIDEVVELFDADRIVVEKLKQLLKKYSNDAELHLSEIY